MWVLAGTHRWTQLCCEDTQQRLQVVQSAGEMELYKIGGPRDWLIMAMQTFVATYFHRSLWYRKKTEQQTPEPCAFPKLFAQEKTSELDLQTNAVYSNLKSCTETTYAGSKLNPCIYAEARGWKNHWNPLELVKIVKPPPRVAKYGH